ncbi:Glycylpeptide N-tetradecanoyltransferase [Zancudomyces culisetae]|uniref:Glycylpeptide N-tetradecanoyltransferase n=2 Tax=Zancudomyces culisetae TaxID=1213189 RepID=A0A1R1PFP5_ZANCU|nr:Glycylpeptide N-tetradecanoyltransferase [Zancudomyces culisetae]|eukprot:OMH79733.1 Glycylpeptide N-tetradecanoyltransferase [Zancudomyces culisetae]
MTAEQTNAIRDLIERLGGQYTLFDTDSDAPNGSESGSTSASTKKAHEFWDTQPVQRQDRKIAKDGPIHPDIPLEKVPREPVTLPEGYYWSEINVDDEAQLKEIHNLLSVNYVEDVDEMFRFKYSADFLIWALKSPGYRSEWNIGIRNTGNKELQGFVSGTEMDLRVNETNRLKMTEINFLCLSKKLRKSRMAPLLIKEITRRTHLKGIFQALYTAGVRLPTPFTICQYYHRPLNIRKLVDTGFSKVPPGSSLSALVAHYDLKANIYGEEKLIGQLGGNVRVRPMQAKDVPQVRKLLNRYLRARSRMHPVFDNDETVGHWLLPRTHTVYSYVVEEIHAGTNNPTGKVLDMISFYMLPSTVLSDSKHSHVNCAYLFYYCVNPEPVTVESCQSHGIDPTGLSKTALRSRIKASNSELVADRVRTLMTYALGLAKRDAHADVFNCVDMLDNNSFVDQLRFGRGDGFLHYYFYNWQLGSNSALTQRDVGLFML